MKKIEWFNNGFTKGIEKKWNMTPIQLIVIGFFLLIMTGTLLLSLPIATSLGTSPPFLDALFTATTSVCVTGLVVVDTASYWSLFGQIVILVLIQCGGLGIISFTTGFLVLLHRKITLKDRMILEEAFNLNSLSGLLRFLRNVFRYTIVIEGIGAILLSIPFVREYGPLTGIWYAIFHSISAFCNAGLDLLGPNSLIPYQNNIIVCSVVMCLIVCGGLGFPVWFDITHTIKSNKGEKYTFKKLWSRLRLHSKLILAVTSVLILSGAFFFLIFEYHNPETMGEVSIGWKLFRSLFQSVTIRTAGFATIPQQCLTSESALLSIIYMFIGGSPVGTAGGIKTATAGILIITAWCLVRGRDHTVCFSRMVRVEVVRKAVAVTIISFTVTMVALMTLLFFENGDFLDLFFEVVSAIATVGLTRNVTGGLGIAGKIIIILCMYLGRIGPISLIIALGRKKIRGKLVYAEGDIIVG